MDPSSIPFAENYVWTTRSFSNQVFGNASKSNIKKTERWISDKGLDFDLIIKKNLSDEYKREVKLKVVDQVVESSRKRRKSVIFASIESVLEGKSIFFYYDGRNARRWLFLETNKLTDEYLLKVLKLILKHEGKDTLLIPTGLLVASCRSLTRLWRSNEIAFKNLGKLRLGLEVYSHSKDEIKFYKQQSNFLKLSDNISHLDKLEAEAIYIMREVVAEAVNPVMLYSLGKDSSVMLHIARKAFYPSSPPFPLMHIDTRWKFKEMYDFRDYIVKESGMELLVHTNPEGIQKNINPFDHGSKLHTNIMKTEGLKQALNHYKFDMAFGGARRDEEKSRSKERIFSFRTDTHQWDPKNQRPELWNIYNCYKKKGESNRVFPLSNWTELDIWQYIYREQIPIVPLYFASERPVVRRDGMLIMINDNRIQLYPSEKIEIKKVRFRTLGCYPLTGAVESDADELASIILELLSVKTSERQGRAIDTDDNASMEKKKKEGYF